MAKLVSMMHISLDGFVARPNKSLDWVKVSDEMFGLAGERTANAKTAIYGAGTFQIMEAYWPTAADKADASKHDIEHSTWYKKVDKVVVSGSMRGQSLPGTTIISDDVAAQIAALKQDKEGEIISFGSPSLTGFLMQHNLIDEYWLLINPIILGEGLTMFKNPGSDVRLKLVSSDTFPGGVVCLHYVLA